VGKTNLLSRLSNDEFSDEFVSTIGGALRARSAIARALRLTAPLVALQWSS
jgi:ABC-type arginine transport system ATPase subunit